MINLIPWVYVLAFWICTCHCSNYFDIWRCQNDTTITCRFLSPAGTDTYDNNCLNAFNADNSVDEYLSRLRRRFAGTRKTMMRRMQNVDIPFTPHPTPSPTSSPTPSPSPSPTPSPSFPTPQPTPPPSPAPTRSPTKAPTTPPTRGPTRSSSQSPTAAPTMAPTSAPTIAPTNAPTMSPTAGK